MSVCKRCGFVGGWHYTWCIHPNPKGALASSVEWFGRLQVHQPVPAPKPQENTK